MEKPALKTDGWQRLRYAPWAPFYDVVARIVQDNRRRALELAALQPGEKVLILGAGTGLDLEYIEPGPELTAIDITPAMISRLRKRARRRNLRVNALVMDGQKLEFPDTSFDVVLLHFVLAVVPNPVRMLTEVARVLRPGGRVIVLNKFVGDDAEPGWLCRFANPVVRLVATDLTCKLGPLVKAVPELNNIYEEPAGFGGHFKLAILRKA